jgi:phosphoenolpyruvate carboxykinase (ATP)
LTISATSNTCLSYLAIDQQNEVFYNHDVAKLIESILLEHEGVLSHTGAVIVETGVHTGRSPNDKYLVDNQTASDAEIAWGDVNKSISALQYETIYKKVKQYLAKRKLYVQDAIAGRDPNYTKTFRFISDQAWAALFTRDLLKPIVLDVDEIPDFTLLHVPKFSADPVIDGTRTGIFVIINFAEKMILIGGTSYAGEIKKSVFTVMNRVLPKKNVFPMN